MLVAVLLTTANNTAPQTSILFRLQRENSSRIGGKGLIVSLRVRMESKVVSFGICHALLLLACL